MIRISDLRLSLGGKVVLGGIDLRVGKGEAVALVGPNGSGKTSVLRCILGLAPFEGRIEIHGCDVVKDPVGARRQIGYLPQKPAFGTATAEEALRFVARLRRLDRKRVGEVLAEVGLAGHAKEPARTFSGGMQQRLSLAMALLTDAPVMLLDEPTASLDREGQRTFLEIALELRKRGRTLLLASHRSEEISRLTDRVISLEGGRLAGLAPLAAVLPFSPVLGGAR